MCQNITKCDKSWKDVKNRKNFIEEGQMQVDIVLLFVTIVTKFIIIDSTKVARPDFSSLWDGESLHGQWILVDPFLVNGWILVEIFRGWILGNIFHFRRRYFFWNKFQLGSVLAMRPETTMFHFCCHHLAIQLIEGVKIIGFCNSSINFTWLVWVCR